MELQTPDPYAPPKTEVENKEPAEVSTKGAYRDGSLLVIHPDSEWPNICPKTGQNVDYISFHKSIKLKQPLKLKDRPKWVNIVNFTIIGVIIAKFILLNQVGDQMSWLYSTWSSLVLIGALFLVTPFAAKYHRMMIPFSDEYLTKRKVRGIVLVIATLLVLVLSWHIVHNHNIVDPSVIKILGIIFVVMVLVCINYYSSPLKVRDYNDEYLYITGVHLDFITRLPAVPLSLSLERR